MAVKGFAVVQNLSYVGNGEARVDVSYCSTVADPEVNAGNSYNVTVGVGYLAAIAAAVQADLETAGVSITSVIDSIRIGENILVAV